MRLWLILIAMLALAVPARAETFAEFLRAFEARAVDAGVSRETYRRVTDGLTPDPNTPKLVETQPEFATPMWEYLDARITDGRISRGRAAIEKNDALFRAVGRTMGVDPFILGAIWADFSVGNKSAASGALVSGREPVRSDNMLPWTGRRAVM